MPIKLLSKIPSQLPPDVTLVDTHCHLDMSAYGEDLDQVLLRARDAGVTRIVSVGIDLVSSRAAIDLARHHQGIVATVGVHPHNIAELTDSQYLELQVLAREPEVVAWGEIGMDSVRSHTPLALQREHFQRQVLLAKAANLPLVIHDREAHVEVMEILQRESPYPAGGVMHCFSGDSTLARAVMELGFYISITGVVTYNKADMLAEVVRTVPLTALLLETDGPYLTAVPWRGKRNEPAYLLSTAQKVADLKNISLAEVAQQTSINAAALFGDKW
ncbi:MAG: hydrolase TatD [Deltaproteobacteria bacterium RIFOXYD12_FULL_50_9]|nr:MAG: hydrolase TatD [Deltaproteobacteria bacterium RIFOXYD12_FULL_50_9]